MPRWPEYNGRYWLKLYLRKVCHVIHVSSSSFLSSGTHLPITLLWRKGRYFWDKAHYPETTPPLALDIYRGPTTASVNKEASKFNTHFLIIPGSTAFPLQVLVLIINKTREATLKWKRWRAWIVQSRDMHRTNIFFKKQTCSCFPGHRS